MKKGYMDNSSGYTGTFSFWRESNDRRYWRCSMKNTMTTALLLAGFIGVLGSLGPALDTQPEVQERSFTQKANDQCGNADWFLDDNGDVVCQKRKPLNIKRVKL